MSLTEKAIALFQTEANPHCPACIRRMRKLLARARRVAA